MLIFHCYFVSRLVFIREGHEKTRIFAYTETKMQISCANTAQIAEQCLCFCFTDSEIFFFFDQKFQMSEFLLCLSTWSRPVSVRPGQKPQRLIFLKL